MTGASNSRRAGDHYADLIAEGLTRELEAGASLAQRGVTIISTSGVLVSLLFALAAIVTRNKEFKLPPLAESLMPWAMGAFVAAALLGLATNVPMKYMEPTDLWLGRLVDRRIWDAHPALGSRRSAQARLGALVAARAAHRKKAWLLTLAMAAEGIAITLLAIAVADVLM